ncbi:carbamoyltransferase [Cellulosimicrobium protaetiae]|uniref:Carbamoyltransferase n=1 Tax=Cellulosimicrobium protaetiae TaxID=2587808 RepID=A0A6M5UCC1_9MICO|nr:carbamoyltransferase C-terminal domain-containing protein [Cellulosimicrobium protaetiae]QJW34845.1 carbamoyltransferase [Cellulosimicrobium protaetiae]
MIVVGYNGFSRSRELFAELYGRDGRDQHRVLGHDAGVSVFVDGRLVYAVEEERVSRRKKSSDFPELALRTAMAETGLRLEDVDRFAFGWAFTPAVQEALRERAARVTRPGRTGETTRLDALYDDLVSHDAVCRDLARRTGLDVDPARVELVPHHLAHLYCGYRLAPPGDVAYLVSDGRAELLSSTSGEFRDGARQTWPDLDIPLADSVAMLYSKVTRYLGFVPNMDEYKVMGLAAYARSADNPLLENVVELLDGGRYRLSLEHPLRDEREYVAVFDDLFRPPGSRLDLGFRARVARAAQEVVETVTAHQATEIARRTGARTLLFEGGLAENSVNNGRLARTAGFEDVLVSFAASDCGVAIGAGAYVASCSGDDLVRDASPYLGSQFGPESIRRALARFVDAVDVEEIHPDRVAQRVARILLGPLVVGWFQGRAEFGPRALGHRSILANPTFENIREVINVKVKHREPFRPFAPVVLERDAPRVFDLGKKSSSPYMTFVVDVLPEWRARVPGVVHVDGTARVQTVPDDGTMLARLLDEFSERSGTPCLVNTSFNVAGEPIVRSPEDAVRCFLSTEIDVLVLGTFLVTKRVRTAREHLTDTALLEDEPV